MALHIPKAPSIPQTLMDGVRYFSRLEEAIYRNTSACKQFAQSVRTTYGPNGINKMVINHLEKLFVTSEAATIIKQLDIEHPAVKLSVLASEVQEAEVGGGRNFVIIFAGALLEVVEEHLRLDITTVKMVEGYEITFEKTLDELLKLVIHEAKDYRDVEQLKAGTKSTIISKQYGKEDFITDLLRKSCISILPSDKE